MSNVPVIKFLFRSEWNVLSEALQLNPIYESVEIGSANDLSVYLTGTPAGLIVTSLRDKNDLVQLATFLKQIKKSTNPPSIKVFVVNFSGDKQFEKAVAKLGILDIIEHKIQTKALRFKIDFMMKSVNAQVKKNAGAQGAPAAVKTLENKTLDKKVSENAPVWENPLDCEDDIWLLKSEQDCKKVLTRWLVKLMGPSPYVAQWVDTGTAGVWKFDFKGENVFIFGKGHWYFRGDQKPDFIWSENIWSFTGSSFELFYKEDEVVNPRLKLKDKILTIAKNSDYAKTKENSIVESFDKELVFKKTGIQPDGSETLEKDQDNFKNLEGKGKTDALNQGPLSGKGKTSQISTDPLSMDLKPGENQTSSDPLSQKAETGKTSSFWKGKNEYQPEGTADLTAPVDQNAKNGSELSLENKNTHEKFYKNHNEAEKFEAKDIGHAIKKDGVSDNLKGKTSTDEIEGHLTSPDAKKEKSEKEKSAGDLSGKSSTDKLPGHLTSPDARKDSAFANESGATKGKSPSDKKETAAKSTEEMNGKSVTDKLSAHLTSPAAKSKGSNEESSAHTNEPAALKEAREKLEKLQAAKKVAHAKKTETDGSTDRPETLFEDNSADELSDSGNQKDLQELKKALLDGKLPSKKGENVTDKLASHYSSKSQQKSESKNEDQLEDKILPFSSKTNAEKNQEESLPFELAQAVMTAKVTSYLSQDKIQVLCQLDDHFDQTIIFVTSEKGLTPSREVSLNLNFNYLNKDTNLRFNGQVMEIQPDGDGAHYVTVEISKENVSAFNSFMKLYNTRQENINLFLKTAKGI